MEFGCRHERDSDDFCPLRHCVGIANWRMADGSVWSQADSAVYWYSLFRRRIRFRVGDECLHLHHRAGHRWSGHWHFDSGGSSLHVGNCTSQAPWTTGWHVSIQHRLRYPRRLPVQRFTRLYPPLPNKFPQAISGHGSYASRSCLPFSLHSSIRCLESMPFFTSLRAFSR